MNPQNHSLFENNAATPEESPVPAVQVRNYTFAYPSGEGDRRESPAVLSDVSLLRSRWSHRLGKDHPFALSQT